MVLTALYEAAHILLTRAVRFSSLKRWAVEVAKRRGMRRAEGGGGRARGGGVPEWGGGARGGAGGRGAGEGGAGPQACGYSSSRVGGGHDVPLGSGGGRRIR